jgi:membrane fusion protein (multidrug efflux system)
MGRGQAVFTLTSVMLFGVACGVAEEVAVIEAPPVYVSSVEPHDFEERIEASGELQAKDRADIASEIAGAVTKVAADEGDPVIEGQLLLAIDPEKRQLELANARARHSESKATLAEAERELARIQKLHAQGIASESNLDEKQTELSRAQSRHAAARAELGVSERALRDANVRSPFAGFVARREVSRGEYVQPGQVLFEIVSLNPIELEFNVAERDSARVAIGQHVRVTVAPYPDEAFRGDVTVIAPTLDARTRTLRVKALIDNADTRLRPGLFARADLGVALRRDLLWVPQEAVLLRADGQIVWVVDGEDRVRRASVRTGIHHDGRVEVLEGLAEGDEVVVRGHSGLQDGVAVSRRGKDGAPDRGALNVASEGDEPVETL